MMTTKAAATAAEAPPIDPAITLASERMASPAVVLRKNRTQRAYSCHVPTASLRRHAPPPESPPSAADGPSSPSLPPGRRTSSGGYLTSQAAPPITTA